MTAATDYWRNQLALHDMRGRARYNALRPTLIVAYGSKDVGGLGYTRSKAIGDLLGWRRWTVEREFVTLPLLLDRPARGYAHRAELRQQWLDFDLDDLGPRTLVFGLDVAVALGVDDREWFEVLEWYKDRQVMRCPCPWSSHDMRRLRGVHDGLPLPIKRLRDRPEVREQANEKIREALRWALAGGGDR